MFREPTSFLGCDDLCVYNVLSSSKQSVRGDCCSINIFIFNSCDLNIIPYPSQSLSLLSSVVMHFVEKQGKYLVHCFSERCEVL